MYKYYLHIFVCKYFLFCSIHLRCLGHEMAWAVLETHSLNTECLPTATQGPALWTDLPETEPTTKSSIWARNTNSWSSEQLYSLNTHTHAMFFSLFTVMRKKLDSCFLLDLTPPHEATVERFEVLSYAAPSLNGVWCIDLGNQGGLWESLAGFCLCSEDYAAPQWISSQGRTWWFLKRLIIFTLLFVSSSWMAIIKY